MKKIILIAISLMLAIGARAQKEGEIVKTGLNFGPLPAIAFDADKGFQYGALLQVFNYGNGENYPNYTSKMYMEYSRFTKGSQLIQFPIGKTVDVAEQVKAKFLPHTGRCHCGEILRRNGASEAHQRKPKKYPSHGKNRSPISGIDTVINHFRNDKRHQQFKDCFEHFEQRCHHCLNFIMFDISRYKFHILLLCFDEPIPNFMPAILYSSTP